MSPEQVELHKVQRGRYYVLRCDPELVELIAGSGMNFDEVDAALVRHRLGEAPVEELLRVIKSQKTA